MKYLTCILLLLSAIFNGYSQPTFGSKIGDNVSSVHDTSILELETTDKTFVLPRMTTVQMNAITPLEGAMIFNTSVNSIYKYDGTNWVRHGDNVMTGSIKYSIKTTDFNGWYLMDGRALSLLSTTAQNNAADLGIAGNLPDAQGRFLKFANGTDSMLLKGGSNSIVLTQANLPNISFNGSSDSKGSHNHSGDTDTNGYHNHSYSDNGDTPFYGGNGSNIVSDNTSATRTTDPAGNHSHDFTTDQNGSHKHTVSMNSGGSDLSIENRPSYLVVNTFIYLGH